jgi:hypothetical protein
MRHLWKAALGTSVLVLCLSACSGGSSGGSAPAPSGTATGAKAGIRAVAACLSAHGSDPSVLAGLVTGSSSAPLTKAQRSALETAAKSCESALPAAQSAKLVSRINCLNSHGLKLDPATPLESLMTLDSSKASVTSALSRCAPAARAGTPS